MDEPSVRAYVRAHETDLRADLGAWLRIPSISADPAYAGEVARSARWLVEALRRDGFPQVSILPTAGDDGRPGHPAVFASWPSDDPAAPTVLVYGHHDVQPVDPLDAWTSPPFEPTARGDDLLVARGASDCKGQVAFHRLGLHAHLATTGRRSPAVHLKVLVEGEEESGSPNFARLLRTHREQLACDLVLVSDTPMVAADVPSIVVSMRGMVAGQIDLSGPGADLHSGQFGGAVPNPLHAMVDLLSGLHDGHGRVAVPGFYDRVRPLSDVERAALARLPFNEDDWLAGTALSSAATGEAGYSTLERLGARPTTEVNGIWGGHAGEGPKTIIPREAHAKVSFRLVADQRPAEVQDRVAAWLAAGTPPGIRLSITWYGPGVRPCTTPLDHPAVDAVLAAVGRAFDAPVLTTREGGSGPEADLQDILAPVVFLGAMLPTDRFHAPDEHVSVGMLLKGAEAVAHLWRDLPAALADR